MSRWFRHYAGMMRDDKLVRIAIKSKQPIERVVWVWGAILESAAEIDDGGRYDFDAAEAAYFLRADEADIGAVENALAAAGHLAEGCVVKWRDRQFQSDKSASRQAAYRERKRAGDGGRDDRQKAGDGEVTSASRHGDAPEAETDTEKREDASASSSRAAIADLRMAISKAFEASNSPNFPDTSRAEVWLSRGWKPSVCVAIVSEILARKNSVSSLSYFEKAIADAHVVPDASPQGRAPPSNGRRSPLMTAIAKIAGEIHERDSQTANVEIFSPGAGPSPDGYGDRLHGERYRA